jgi:hypothetical protein
MIDVYGEEKRREENSPNLRGSARRILGDALSFGSSFSTVRFSANASRLRRMHNSIDVIVRD